MPRSQSTDDPMVESAEDASLAHVTVDPVTGSVVDPEIVERQVRIEQLEADLEAEEHRQRRARVDADRQVTIKSMEDHEAELRNRLANLRGERREE